jgi:two-component system NtrC family response regulator
LTMDDSRTRILIVDDDPGITSQLELALSGEYEVFTAGDLRSGLETLGSRSPDIALLDVALSNRAGDRSGLELLRESLKINPSVKAIMVTGIGERECALEAVRLGAYDFYSKPIELEELKIIVARAAHLQRLERENQELTKKLSESSRFPELLGNSEPMREVFRLVEAVAPTEVTVLLTGPSGTGKELVASAIHRESPREEAPFIPINCGAIPETLLESELFGHTRGAFTGAHKDKTGKFEQAEGGTIFLDEVGELPSPLQVKLLRFLQDRKIEKLGGGELKELDVRIIAATNQDLTWGIASGKFREDLYYRLSVVSIDLPPLKDRGDDIYLLAQHFLEVFSKKHGKGGAKFTPQALEHIRHDPWPGNVRELENRIQKGIILSDGRKITLQDLGFASSSESSGRVTLSQFRTEAEAPFIRQVIERNRGNLSKTARQLSISRTTLYELLERYGISTAARHVVADGKP